MKDIKLKYYLRGLGIGVLVTVLILGIAGNGEESMTDAQIRERAAELGMVDADSLVLSELRESEPQTETADVQEPETTVESSEVQEEENGGADEPETQEPQKTDEVTDSENEEEMAETENPPEALDITIESGAGSYNVSKLLYENKLVDDADEFDTYLCDIGYSRSIRAGTYRIPVDATWEEIAKIITGKR